MTSDSIPKETIYGNNMWSTMIYNSNISGNNMWNAMIYNSNPSCVKAENPWDVEVDTYPGLTAKPQIPMRDWSQET